MSMTMHICGLLLATLACTRPGRRVQFGTERLQRFSHGRPHRSSSLSSKSAVKPEAVAYIGIAPKVQINRLLRRRPVLASAAAVDNVNDRKNPALYTDSATTDTATSTPQLPLSRPPTLLAPAGGWPQLHAAVNSGADAVYFGVRENFNARARAANFHIDELSEVMSYLRAHNVRGYCTVNVLVFDSELQQLETLLRSLASAGVDALIVQDVGAIQLVRKLAPNLPVHASTQMSITSADGAEFARNLGCERVVVGRELSTKEITAVAQNTEAEIEAFVHGALCVSYSGQCFSSEAWGGRSANRGQCAQACRLPYGLLVNGSLAELGDIQYLLSPQDLAGLAHVPRLIRAGVHCFKVEGRLKPPEYVAVTTTAYREAIDHAWRVLTDDPTASDDAATLPSKRLLSLGSNLAQIFARGQDEHNSGLSPGFLDGSRHQHLVRGRSPGHRGMLVGVVTDIDVDNGLVTVGHCASTDAEGTKRDAVMTGLDVKLPTLKRGDGIVFDSTASRGGVIKEEPEQGGAVFHVREGADEIEITFGRAQGAPDLSKVQIGDKVWRNHDAALERSLRRAATRPLSARTAEAGIAAAEGLPPAAAVHVRVRGSLGSPLHIRIEDAEGLVGEAASATPLQQARSSPLTSETVKSAIGALGGDGLLLGTYDDDSLLFESDGGLFLPAKELKAARRAAVEALLSVRRSHGRADGMGAEEVLPSLVEETVHAVAKVRRAAHHDVDEVLQEPDRNDVEFSVLCRTPEQVAAAIQVPSLNEVAVDFLEVHGLQKAVNSIKAAGKRVVVATPRILKPDEERLWKFYLRLGADALLVRSVGLLHKLQSLGSEGAAVSFSTGKGRSEFQLPALHGDFSLNAVNVISSGLFLASGIARLTPGHDASGKQIAELAKALGPQNAGRLEVVAHQHLPVFHTEHCVFCRFLSDGDNYTNCGHPCEKNQVHLRDSSGRDHLVLADMGCRNTVFNAQAQSAVNVMPRLLRAGVRRFRIELVDEPASFVAPLLEKYAQVAADPAQARSAWRWLQSVPDANGNAQGVTLGSLIDKQELAADNLKPTRTAVRAEQIAESKAQQRGLSRGAAEQRRSAPQKKLPSKRPARAR